MQDFSAEIQVEILDLDTYIEEDGVKSSGPTRFDCSRLLQDVEKIESKPNAKKLILIPGLYSLYDSRLRDIASMKLFIDCDADTRLTRWSKCDSNLENYRVPLTPILKQ